MRKNKEERSKKKIHIKRFSTLTTNFSAKKIPFISEKMRKLAYYSDNIRLNVIS